MSTDSDVLHIHLGIEKIERLSEANPRAAGKARADIRETMRDELRQLSHEVQMLTYAVQGIDSETAVEYFAGLALSMPGRLKHVREAMDEAVEYASRV